MKLILFVCEGNTCRSFMAERIARDKILGDVKFESAGTDSREGDGPAQLAIDALAYDEIDGAGHEPRSVWKLDFDSYDKIIAMDEKVKKALKEKKPELELDNWDIDDPWTGDAKKYSECAEKIMEKILELKLKLKL